MFFYGEDAVTDGLSPYIDAAPKEEQKYFLATQQVDEARHSVFFHRFFKEVIGAGDTPLGRPRLHRAVPRLGLQGRLRPARDDGRRAPPRPLAAQVRAGDHPLPPDHRGLDGPARPALHRGLLHQGGDDARLLRGHAQRLARRAAPHRLRRQGPLRAARGVRRVQGRGRARSCARCSPTSSRSSCRRTGTRRTRPRYGFTLRGHLRLRDALGRDEVEGDRLSRSSEMPRGASTPSTPRCRTRSARTRQIKLLKAGVLGEPNGIAPAHARGPGDLLRRRRALGEDRRVDAPMTIQWKFTDADPWHIRIDNGSTAASAGRGARRRRDAGDDLGRVDRDLDAGREPAKAVCTRKLRPRGGLRNLARMGQVWERGARRRRLSPGASVSGPRTRRR